MKGEPLQEQDGSRGWLTSENKQFKEGTGKISHVDGAHAFWSRQHKCQIDISVPVVKDKLQSATVGFSSWTWSTWGKKLKSGGQVHITSV